MWIVITPSRPGLPEFACFRVLERLFCVLRAALGALYGQPGGQVVSLTTGRGRRPIRARLR